VAGEFAHFFSALAFTTLIATSRHRQYPAVAIGGLILNVVLNLWLIPARSFQGAAIATLVTEVAVATTLIVMAMRIDAVSPLPVWGVLRGIGAFAAAMLIGAAFDTVVPWPVAAVVTAAAFLVIAHLVRIGGPGGLMALLREDEVSALAEAPAS
jgi:O-antigen/teichoic acid export membrane protein